jgi:hypothetical protein
MTKEESIEIIRVQDILIGARSCVECVWLAAMGEDGEGHEAITTVADIASDKIKEAIEALETHRRAKGFCPELTTSSENEAEAA